MTGSVGTGTFKGLAVPLYGSYEQVQEAVGDVMVTLTGKVGMTADFVNFRGSTGTSFFSVSAAGVLNVVSITQSTPTALATVDALNGTSAPTTAMLTANGMLATAMLNGTTAKIYFRTNNAVYSVSGA